MRGEDRLGPQLANQPRNLPNWVAVNRDQCASTIPKLPVDLGERGVDERNPSVVSVLENGQDVLVEHEHKCNLIGHSGRLGQRGVIGEPQIASEPTQSRAHIASTGLVPGLSAR